MNQASPCPYCGNIGFHVWAEACGCPGAVPERERDAAAAVLIQALTEQNRTLQLLLADELAKMHGTLFNLITGLLASELSKAQQILVEAAYAELRQSLPGRAGPTGPQGPQGLTASKTS